MALKGGGDVRLPHTGDRKHPADHVVGPDEDRVSTRHGELGFDLEALGKRPAE
jgi:hypothetical protein